MNRRALSERSELARPHPLRPPSPMWLDGGSMALGHFAEPKGPRLPGRNPHKVLFHYDYRPEMREALQFALLFCVWV
jgi:hypothetical protein